MLRLSLNAPPNAWYPADIPTEDGPVAVRVRFKLLSAVEAAAASAKRLRLVHALQGGDQSLAFDLMLAELAPTELAQITTTLREHILDWDIEDADTGKRLAVTDATLTAVLDRAAFLRPLWSALIDASTNPGLKKTSAPGSAGSSTPTPDPGTEPVTAGAA